jgi:hypothetical protein
LALGHLDAEFVKTSPIAKNALVQFMNNLDDKEFVQLQDKYTLPEGNERLISMIGKGEKVGDAGNALFKSPQGVQLAKNIINNPKQEDLAIKILGAIRWNGEKRS